MELTSSGVRQVLINQYLILLFIFWFTILLESSKFTYQPFLGDIRSEYMDQDDETGDDKFGNDLDNVDIDPQFQV